MIGKNIMRGFGNSLFLEKITIFNNFTAFLVFQWYFQLLISLVMKYLDINTLHW